MCKYLFYWIQLHFTANSIFPLHFYFIILNVSSSWRTQKQPKSIQECVRNNNFLDQWFQTFFGSCPPKCPSCLTFHHKFNKSVSSSTFLTQFHLNNLFRSLKGKTIQYFIIREESGEKCRRKYVLDSLQSHLSSYYPFRGSQPLFYFRSRCILDVYFIDWILRLKP